MKTHGMAGTSIYNKWENMKARCLNPNRKAYKDYGGRGITICDEWLEFENFYNDVSTLEHCDEDGYTLDRIDVNGNYELSNVRWVKKSMQNRNKRDNIYVDYYGVNMLLLDAAKITGINYDTLKSRYHKGDRGDRLFRPVKKLMPKSDLIVIDNNQALTTSLKVAEYFGKRHDNVLQAIEKELANLRKIGARTRDLNFKDSKIDAAFIKGEYEVEGQKRKYPMYYLNRDAFFQIIFGFTGEEASELRWNFIQEFNRMEAALKELNSKR